MAVGDLRLGLSPCLGGQVFVMRETEKGAAIVVPQPEGYPFLSWAAWVAAHPEFEGARREA